MKWCPTSDSNREILASKASAFAILASRAWCVGRDSNSQCSPHRDQIYNLTQHHRRCRPRKGIAGWCVSKVRVGASGTDSNLRPAVYKTAALPLSYAGALSGARRVCGEGRSHSVYLADLHLPVKGLATEATIGPRRRRFPNAWPHSSRTSRDGSTRNQGSTRRRSGYGKGDHAPNSGFAPSLALDSRRRRIFVCVRSASLGLAKGYRGI